MPDGEVSRTRWDVVVVGTGSGGKMAAVLLAGQGLDVLAIERGRFGGECPYVACVPAKSLLLSAFAGLDWPTAVERRDEAADHRDDRAGRTSLEEAGVHVRRGSARLLPPTGSGHRVVVTDPDGRETTHTAARVVLGTGSHPVVPDVDGLADADYWTSDAAYSASQRPASLVVLGGGAVGCELAQAYQLLGTRVTLLEVAGTLLPPEPDWVGELLAGRLRADGVDVRTDVTPSRVVRTDEGWSVELEDGRSVAGERVVVAGGRAPTTEGLGLEALGVDLEDDGSVPVDGHLRVLGGTGVVEGLYAVGDVTADSSYTHSANHQARVLAAGVAGSTREADYRAIPRVVYTDPAVFCVGLTAEQARDQGLDVGTQAFDLGDTERGVLTALSDPRRDPVRGRLELVVDKQQGIVVGAACAGPQADSWGAELALAVAARIPVEDLRWGVRAFPTWSEGVTAALD